MREKVFMQMEIEEGRMLTTRDKLMAMSFQFMWTTLITTCHKMSSSTSSSLQDLHKSKITTIMT